MQQARPAGDRLRFVGVAPNGGRLTPLDHPALPITVAALAETARTCRLAGAAMIHLHVRDRAGLHVLDADLYREAIAAVKNAVGDDMVIQITTESVGRYSPSQQMAVVRAVRPPAVSLAAREFCLDAASAEAFAGFVAETVKAGAAVQVIIYEAPELARFEALAARGLFDLAALSLLYVCGVYGRRAACVADVTGLLPRPAAWRDVMVCAFGAAETAVVAAAARRGADVRIGFENNLCLPAGERAPHNAALVAATVEALQGADLTIGAGEALARRWGLR